MRRVFDVAVGKEEKGGYKYLVVKKYIEEDDLFSEVRIALDHIETYKQTEYADDDVLSEHADHITDTATTYDKADYSDGEYFIEIEGYTTDLDEY